MSNKIFYEFINKFIFAIFITVFISLTPYINLFIIGLLSGDTIGLPDIMFGELPVIQKNYFVWYANKCCLNAFAVTLIILYTYEWTKYKDKLEKFTYLYLLIYGFSIIRESSTLYSINFQNGISIDFKNNLFDFFINSIAYIPTIFIVVVLMIIILEKLDFFIEQFIKINQTIIYNILLTLVSILVSIVFFLIIKNFFYTSNSKFDIKVKLPISMEFIADDSKNSFELLQNDINLNNVYFRGINTKSSPLNISWDKQKSLNIYDLEIRLIDGMFNDDNRTKKYMNEPATFTIHNIRNLDLNLSVITENNESGHNLKYYILDDSNTTNKIQILNKNRLPMQFHIDKNVIENKYNITTRVSEELITFSHVLDSNISYVISFVNLIDNKANDLLSIVTDKGDFTANINTNKKFKFVDGKILFKSVGVLPYSDKNIYDTKNIFLGLILTLKKVENIPKDLFSFNAQNLDAKTKIKGVIGDMFFNEINKNKIEDYIKNGKVKKLALFDSHIQEFLIDNIPYSELSKFTNNIFIGHDKRYFEFTTDDTDEINIEYIKDENFLKIYGHSPYIIVNTNKANKTRFEKLNASRNIMIFIFIGMILLYIAQEFLKYFKKSD